MCRRATRPSLSPRSVGISRLLWSLGLPRTVRHHDRGDQVSDFNTAIIEEFRANEGRVGGGFAGAPMLLLHHTGAKSGQERVSPLVYRDLGDSIAIFGSKGGAPTHPAWYLNLAANPETTIEIGTETR